MDQTFSTPTLVSSSRDRGISVCAVQRISQSQQQVGAIIQPAIPVHDFNSSIVCVRSHLLSLRHMQRHESRLICSRAIHNASVYFDPRMRKEWRRAITDYQTRVDTVSSEQANCTNGSLQTQDWLPVEACGE